MEFRCHDLREAGVILVPQIPPIGATLINQSDKPIVAWSLQYRTEDESGRAGGANIIMSGNSIPSLLFPYGLTQELRKQLIYQNAILPGSRRYIEDGELIGDNTDVRPPQPDEVWKGATFGFGSGSRLIRDLEEMKSVTLILDSIFFADGEFAGPNQLQLFDLIVYAAEVYRDVANIALQLVKDGRDTDTILRAVEKETGPSRAPLPPRPGVQSAPEAFREQARAFIAGIIARTRESRGDSEAVSMLVGWAGADLPQYRRR
jgi:hypothetical protein